MIDWNATGSWMQAWAGFANAAVIAWAAQKGSSTLKTWLQQRQLERRHAAAERLLPYAYKAREAFHAIRNPMSNKGELDEVKQSLANHHEGFDNLDGGQRRRLEIAQTAVARVGRYSELWSELSDLLPLARMYFGTRAEAVFRDVWQQRQRIWASAMVYPGITLKENRELHQQCEADFWEGLAPHNGAVDRIGHALDEIVSYAEAEMGPLLRPQDLT